MKNAIRLTGRREEYKCNLLWTLILNIAVISEEQVFGSALLDLSESNLIELGMDKLGDRITFMLQREMLN